MKPYPPAPWVHLISRIVELCPKCKPWTYVEVRVLGYSKSKVQGKLDATGAAKLLFCIDCPISEKCGI